MTTTEKVTKGGVKKAKPETAEERRDALLGPKVCGVYVELTKRAAMLETLKLDEPAASSLSNADLVRIVAKTIVLQTWPKNITDITQCRDCRAFSFFDIPGIPDGCPYCGSSNTVQDHAPVQKEVDEARAACEADSDARPAPPVEETAKTKASVEEKPMTSTSVDAKASKKQTNGAPPPSTPSMLAGGGGAMVKAAPAPIVQHTELELDASIRKYEELKTGAFVSTWDLWNHVRVNIYENNLWKQRRDDKGEAGRYKTWQAFCNAELNCAPATANDLMALCAVVTRNEFQKWGSTKASMLVNSPKEDQPRIRRMIEGKATTRQVKAAITEAHANESLESKKDRIKGTPAQKEARAKGASKLKENRAKTKVLQAAQKSPQAKITVASIEGKHKIVMHTTDSARLHGKQKGELLQAKKMDQLPVGVLDLGHGVKLRLSWRSLAGGFVTDAEFYREE